MVSRYPAARILCLPPLPPFARPGGAVTLNIILIIFRFFKFSQVRLYFLFCYRDRGQINEAAASPIYICGIKWRHREKVGKAASPRCKFGSAFAISFWVTNHHPFVHPELQTVVSDSAPPVRFQSISALVLRGSPPSGVMAPFRMDLGVWATRRRSCRRTAGS